MPRKSKNQPTNQTAANQAYGVAGEQKAAMSVIPLPNTQMEPDTNAQFLQPMSSVPAGSPDIGNQILEAARNAPPPDEPAFSAPSNRPDESVFVAPQNPPSVKVSPAIELLRMIAASNGNDPLLMQIAADAERLKLG